MYSYEYMERLRGILEEAYDEVGLDDETARRCDDRVVALLQKWGPGEEACERILRSLADLSHSPLSLSLLVETVGDTLEALPLPRYVLSERDRRAAEGWGIVARPTPNPQSTPQVRHSPPTPHYRSVQTHAGHIMDCDACNRQYQAVLYTVGREEVCDTCYYAMLHKAWEKHNGNRIESLSRCRKIYI